MQQVPYHHTAVILTGFTNGDKSPHDRVYTNKGADRMLHALALYRQGKIGRFLISGGSGSLQEKEQTEAAEVRNLLLDAGVPPALIHLEHRSRNTYENALFTQHWLKENSDSSRVLLVTAAFHMRRAQDCFKKAGVAITAFPTDFNTTDRMFTPDHLIVPQEAALYHWQRLLHEWMGYVVYSFSGYL